MIEQRHDSYEGISEKLAADSREGKDIESQSISGSSKGVSNEQQAKVSRKRWSANNGIESEMNDDEEEENGLSGDDLRNKGQHRLWGERVGGRFPYSCVVGPDYLCLSFTFLLIIIPSVLILIYVAPKVHWATVIPGAITFFFLLVYLSSAAFSDPGILPKRSKHVKQSNHDDNVAVCPYCNVPRPQGCIHCLDCDACILELDHHCPVCFVFFLFVVLHYLHRRCF